MAREYKSMFVYLLFRWQECSDHYYDPYHHLLHIFSTLEDAVAEADRCILVAREQNFQARYYVEKQRVLPPDPGGVESWSGRYMPKGALGRQVSHRVYEVANEYKLTAEDLLYDFGDGGLA